MMREKPASSQRGMALAVVMIIMACVMIVAFGFVALYMARLRMNNANAHKYTAEYVAETGLNKYLWGLNHDYDFFKQNSATFSGYYPDGNGYYYVTEQNQAASGASPSIATLTCTGWLASDPGNQYTFQATVSKRLFTNSVYESNNETSPGGGLVWWFTGDEMHGPLSTNGTLNIQGSPIFDGTVEYAGSSPNVQSGSTPSYNAGPPVRVQTLTFPQSNSQMATYAKKAGLYLMGRTCIYLHGNQFDYVNYDCNPAHTSTYHIFIVRRNVPFPSNGVIYVDNASGDVGDTDQTSAVSSSQYNKDEKFILTRGNVFVSSYDNTGQPQGLQGHLTIAAANGIYITAVDPTGSVPTGTLLTNIGSSSNSYGLIYGRTTFSANASRLADANVSNGDDMLGLVANNYIMVLEYGWPYYNPSNLAQTTPTFSNDTTSYAPYNINIHAAAMSVNYSFMVEDFWGNNYGNINLYGSLIQQYRGPVGQTDGSGYSKQYWYDPRMNYETPPHYLEPQSAGWGVLNWHRITIPPIPFARTTSITVAGLGNATAALVGGSLQMQASAQPENAFQTVLWSVTNSGGTNATIDPYGGLLIAGNTLGIVTVKATATDGSGKSGQTTVNIVPMVVNPPILPPATADVPYSQTITATGGTPPYGLSITSGSLPAGFTMSGSAISGTATVAGSASFTITATDSLGLTASQNYTLMINAPPITLSPGTLPAATAYVSYSQTITAGGGSSPYAFSESGALPAGITFNNGILSGTPAGTGGFPLTVTATDSYGYTGSQYYILAVNAPAITFNPASLPNGTINNTYSQTIAAAGGTSPYNFSVTSGSLPTGLNMSGGGIISGAPTATGTFSFTITATDSHGFTGSQSYTIITIAPVASVTVTSAGNATSLKHSGTRTTRTLQMYATVLPASANQNVTWTLLDPSSTGSTINSNGLLTAGHNYPGTVTVQATSTDGTNITGTKNILITQN
ncbi:MAG: putative Ig domain-containing protein [Thermacetogeniaceae bacterium]